MYGPTCTAVQRDGSWLFTFDAKKYRQKAAVEFELGVAEGDNAADVQRAMFEGIANRMMRNKPETASSASAFNASSSDPDDESSGLSGFEEPGDGVGGGGEANQASLNASMSVSGYNQSTPVAGPSASAPRDPHEHAGSSAGRSPGGAAGLGTARLSPAAVSTSQEASAAGEAGMSVSEGDATQAPSNAGAEAGSERGVPSAVNLQKMKVGKPADVKCRSLLL